MSTDLYVQTVHVCPLIKNSLSNIMKSCRRTETQKLLNELGWETLHTRRHCQILVLFFKILNNLTPTYMRELLPPRVADRSRYTTRNTENFSTVTARTERYKTSFRIYASKTWNSLPDSLKSAPSLNIFKTRLKKIYYSTHNHLFCHGQGPGLINHTLDFV